MSEMKILIAHKINIYQVVNFMFKVENQTVPSQTKFAVLS